jgi:pyridoxamine 5'-phosphate oxidase
VKEKLSAIRKEYHHKGLTESTIARDPFQQLENWLSDAVDAGIQEPNAMILSTLGRNGRPAARVVLLKGLSPEGLVFFTNYHSRKASDLDAHPVAALVFYWGILERQVRVEGKIRFTSAEESDRYFAERPRNSQIGAWASEQSSVIPDRQYLESRFNDFESEFSGRAVDRPPHWGGYRLVPDYFEFWQGAPGRLHDRIVFEREGTGWNMKRLAP